MMVDPISIEHRQCWRSEVWDADIPSREGWIVTCQEHGWVGRQGNELDRPWAYMTLGIARSVMTRHRRAYHQES